MLKGIIVSLVTNFKADGSLDEEGIRKSVDYYAGCGVHGVCVVGGTGEALSVSQGEYRRAVDAAVRGADGRCLVVAGALYVDPSRIVECCRYAKEAGAAAAMLIPPYFIRAGVRHIETHFRDISETVDFPLILFNTPSRSGIDMSAEMVIKLAQTCPNIVGIKEASASLAKISLIVAGVGPQFSVIQGLDDLVFPTLAMGGKGALISAGTVFPHLYVRMYEAAQAGNYEQARQLQLKVLPYLPSIYCETNPVALKRLLELLGLPGGPPRRPLYPILPENEARLKSVVEEIRTLEQSTAQ